MSRTWWRRAAIELAGPLAAVGVALGCGAVLVALVGQNPLVVYAELATAVFGSAYGFAQVLFKSTTLIGTGLSVAVAFRAGFFNIGAEGQMYLGGLAGAVCAISLPQATPAVVAAPAVLLAAALAGGVWGGIPGVLKARLGVHEVINTIMLNFVAFALGSYLLVEHLAVFETLHTSEIPVAARLARFETLVPGFRGAPLNLSFVLQLLLCAGCFVLLWKTRWGFEVRAVGQGPQAARAAGIPVLRRMVEAMALAGALAGVTASNFVQGYKYYFEEGFTADAGFKGIAVALLARSHPAAIVPSALLFGALDRGGFVINRLVPKELVDILQALVILFVVVLAERTRRAVSRRAAAVEG